MQAIPKFRIVKDDLQLMKERYVTREMALGPIDATTIKHHSINRYLFEEHNRIYRRLENSPSIIIGRRGSGKTAILKQIQFGSTPAIVANLFQDRALDKVMHLLSHGQSDQAFVEESERWWELMIWVAALKEVRDHNWARPHPPGPLPVVISALFDKLKISAKLTAALTVERVLEALADLSERPDIAGSVASALRKLVSIEDLDFDGMRAEVDMYAKSQGCPVFVVADSLDDYFLNGNSRVPAMRGMLKCFGSFNQKYQGIQARLCLPSESYKIFVELSSNELKDFQQSLVIHWTSSELISVAAERIRLSLNIMPRRDTTQAFLERINFLDFAGRQTARDFVREILPAEVTNRFGFSEDALAYILRHTQLLPRQMIFLLKNIFRENFRRTDSQRIDPQSIIEGVRASEDIVWREVVSAYQYTYPMAKMLCENLIPKLGSRFTDADFDRVFAQSGRQSVKDRGFSSNDALKTLIGIGAVGLFTQETEFYCEGQFQYTSLKEIPSLPRESYVLHPMFSGMPEEMSAADFRERRSKAVYPSGSNPQMDVSAYGS